VYLLSLHADIVEQGATEEERKFADNILSVLTPIAKAFLTETGYESANHGVQIFGGHGFISEHGMEQIVRDTRIACLYEGTTEIQALDLLGRKVLQTQGAMLKDFTKIIHKFVEANKDNAAMQEFLAPLAAANKEWGDITMQIGMRAMQNPDEVGAAAVDYMYFSGYVTLAYLWARMALVAQEKLAEGSTDVDFYNAKVTTARFYFFNESLDGITAQLARCFDQKIIITDPELAGVRFYAFFTNNESLLKILGTLNTDKSMSIRERNDVIYISRKK
jgi:hypothetical protein